MANKAIFYVYHLPIFSALPDLMCSYDKGFILPPNSGVKDHPKVFSSYDTQYICKNRWLSSASDNQVMAEK